MNKKQYIQSLFEYRKTRRQKDWVLSWMFSSDKTCPYLQFIRLNPEE